jgi:PAS domain S-box-containing protein
MKTDPDQPFRPAQRPSGSPDTDAPSLRYAEFHFQTVVEAITDYAVFMLDRDGNVATWNAGAERIKGYRADEIIGSHFSRFYPPDAVAAGRPARGLGDAVAHGRFEDEGWRVRKDGSLFWASVTITAVRDEAKRLSGFIKITRDMTERKRLVELEASTHRLSVFIAMLAHELRNQLAPLRNSVGVLQCLPAPDPLLVQCRDAVDRQLAQLTGLVDDLLDVGRITSGKVELDNRPVPVSDIVGRGVEAIQSTLDARAQCIHVDLPAEPAMLQGDEVRLIQVLHNLLDNASKFSPPGSRIDISARIEGQAVAIRVSDRGIGIAPPALESIFDLFEQGGGVGARPSGGFGLGLAICRSFVELHGGSIAAESEGVGRGATFVVRLPIRRSSFVRPAAVSDPTHRATVPLRIVIVDDNRDSADTLGVLLQVKGHAPRVAYDARGALMLAREYVPHLILLDLSMPDVDGFTLLRELRSIDALARTTCVAVSGFGQPADRERTEQAGFDDHLVKPIEIAVLDAPAPRRTVTSRNRRELQLIDRRDLVRPHEAVRRLRPEPLVEDGLHLSALLERRQRLIDCLQHRRLVLLQPDRDRLDQHRLGRDRHRAVRAFDLLGDLDRRHLVRDEALHLALLEREERRARIVERDRLPVLDRQRNRLGRRRSVCRADLLAGEVGELLAAVGLLHEQHFLGRVIRIAERDLRGARLRIRQIRDDDVHPPELQLRNACLDRERRQLRLHAELLRDRVAQIDVHALELARLRIRVGKRLDVRIHAAVQLAVRLHVGQLIGTSGRGAHQNADRHQHARHHLQLFHRVTPF